MAHGAETKARLNWMGLFLSHVFYDCAVILQIAEDLPNIYTIMLGRLRSSCYVCAGKCNYHEPAVLDCNGNGTRTLTLSSLHTTRGSSDGRFCRNWFGNCFEFVLTRNSLASRSHYIYSQALEFQKGVCANCLETYRPPAKAKLARMTTNNANESF